MIKKIVQEKDEDLIFSKNSCAYSLEDEAISLFQSALEVVMTKTNASWSVWKNGAAYREAILNSLRESILMRLTTRNQKDNTAAVVHLVMHGIVPACLGEAKDAQNVCAQAFAINMAQNLYFLIVHPQAINSEE